MAKNLEIDLHDPNVQALLGTDTAGLSTPEQSGRRTLMTLAGDEDHGIESGINLEAGKSMVAVWYEKRELLLELDINMLGGGLIHIGAICPKCHHHLTITSERKRIEWDPTAENPMKRVIEARLSPKSRWRAACGKLSIETFQCTWEMNTDQAVSSDLTIGKGNLCQWRAAIDNNRVKED